MNRPLRILLVEDSAADAELMLAALDSEGIGAAPVRVETRDDLLNVLEKETFDLVLSDYSLPSFDGFSALSLTRARLPETPFIFVSGTIGEERAIEALRSGATDYVLKHRLSRLAPAVRRALAESEERRARLEAEAQRAAAESRFRVLFEQVTIGVAITSLDGRVVSANPALLNMLGHSGGTSLETPLDELAPAGDDARKALQDLRDGAIRSHEWERDFIRKDGSQFLGRVVVSVIRDERGAPQYFINLVEDVTERKEMERRFLQAQKMEVVGRLAAGFAHDFNNLLTVINGYSQLLIARAGESGSGHRELNEVRRAGERATTLTKRLLTLSRQRQQRSEALELNTVISGLQDVLNHLTGEKVSLSLTLDPVAAPIQGDPSCIEQIILNLVINARDAMPDGGQLVISTEPSRMETPDADREGVSPGAYLVLTVADTGCGMDDATKARIFEPFFTTKGVDRGTGLGLWMVHEIVRESGGSIAVDSEIGHGTRFRIWFPTAAAQEHPVASAASAGSAAVPAAVAEPPQTATVAAPAGTILVVDDDPGIRSFVSEVLEMEGYQTLQAADGRGAVDMLRRQNVDLLITDLVMPNQEGLETIQAVKARFPQLPILAMSGGVGERFLDVAEKLGARSVLHKPFSAGEVATAVRYLLDPRRRAVRPAGQS